MLTTLQAIDYCNQLQDKYGSPNVIPAEWINYLNDATNKYINRLLPDSEDGVLNFEQDKLVTANLRPLIFGVFYLFTSGGLITNAALSAALLSSYGEVGTVLRIITLGRNGYPIQYVRHANEYSFNRNYFKRASATNPQYYQYTNGYAVLPTDDSSVVGCTVLKAPRVLSLSPVVDPEFDDYVMYKIIVIALKLAGVATRDEELEASLKAIAK